MNKKFFITLIVLVLIFALCITYFNRVILPTKIKSLIIQNLQEATHKKVKLQSLQFNIFKGLVFKNLILYDDRETILDVREGSCNFLVLPLLKKVIIIPTLELRSLTLYLERRPDQTLSISDLFMQPKTTEAKAQNKKFSLFIYKIKIMDSRINFKDKTFKPEFIKTADNLNLILRLSLPAGVKFNLKSEIVGAPKTKVFAEGEYKIRQRNLQAHISIRDFSPVDFASYYQNSNVSITKGLINALLNIKLKEDILYADLETKNIGLSLAKNKIGAQLNSVIKANIQYRLKDHQLKFSGNTDIARLDISGLEFFDKADHIKGKVNFDNSGFYADKLTAEVLGIPLAARLRLTDLKNPFLNIDITSDLIGLSYIKDILKDKFKFVLPAELQGDGRFFLKIESRLPFVEPLPIIGYLDIFNAMLKFKGLVPAFADINGRIEFSRDQLKWPQLKFRYLDTAYKTEGNLNNFHDPQVQLKLSSDKLYLESEFSVKDSIINFSKFDGRYLNSDFSVKGNIDITEPSSLQTDISAGLNLDLSDLAKTFKKFKEKLEKIKPSGIVVAKISLSGNINDIKSCSMQADISSPSLTIYGLKSERCLVNYRQENGLLDLPLIHLSLYDGTLDAAAKINLTSENMPFWVSANTLDIKLDKLKLDTIAKDKDIAGTLKSDFKINGFLKDISKLTGEGSIFISEGKLWELNLFRGLGKLLFAKDFSSIIFKEGQCDFLVQEESIFTDNLKMKSEFVDLTGSLKIGFDSSVDASLNIYVNDEMVPLSGTFKDVTTAIIGQGRRFGVIRITGNLKEPKYKFKSAVFDMIKALKDAFFRK